MTGPQYEPEPPRQPAEAVPSFDPDEPETPTPAPKPPAPVAAPHWLTALLKPKPAPIDWKRAIRAAVSIAAPMAIGLAVNHLAIGIMFSIGSLVATVTSVSGPYRDRWRRSGLAVLAGAIGFLLGDTVGEHGWWTTALVVLVAAISALISGAGNNASLASLQLLVYVVLGTHEAAIVGPGIAVGCFLGGAAFALLLSVAAWPVRATAPERALVAKVYDQLVAVLSAAGTPAAGPARQALTGALNTAYDALLTARSHLQGRDQIYRRLFVALSETTPVVEAVVALVNARHRPPKSLIDAVAAIGTAIHDDQPMPELDLPETGSPRVLALTEGLYGVIDAMSADHPAPHLPATSRTPKFSDRVQTWLDDTLGGRAIWLHALRLALCMAIAGVLVNILPIDRSYWVFLTVAIVLKPDFGSVFGRAILRGGGTFVGALVGAGILAINPNGWVLVLLVAIIGFLLPIAQVRNYGMFATVLTPLVVVQLDLGRAGTWDLVAARLLDTVVGCAVVLIFGYLLWPASRTPQLGGKLADAIRAVSRYADRALRADPRGRSSLRRRTYRQLSDLRTEFQRVLVEPFTAGRRAAAWYPSIVALERLTSSITRIAVEIDHGEPIPPESEVDALVATLTALADAVRDGAPVPEPPVSRDPIIAPVCADVAQVIAGLRGPDLDSVRPFAPLRRLLPRAPHP
ncbi:MAG TPA: FUSC family protein [Pseudonocardiaceae bacterium]|nr:FUSC family protein [Pseudonocardiaceae bacterium]